MNEDTNTRKENLVLAQPTELFEKAKEIEQNTKSDERFPFALQYDANQKDVLLSMLEAVGTIVENDNDDAHLLSTKMNMTQLAFIKCLDCVERVKTDEGINPFLREEAIQLTPVQQGQQESEALEGELEVIVTNINNEMLEVQSELTNHNTADANLETAMNTERIQKNDSIAIASVGASPKSSCNSSNCSCPTNTSMETAATISDESYTSGDIHCPGGEQWFKFVAQRTGLYTICTTGDLDTIGTLYNCYGYPLQEVDDYTPCGKINFRIIQNLVYGNTYYIKVRLHGNNTGRYILRVTERLLANYVTISKDNFTLKKGVTYELPITPNYIYKGYNGAQRIPELSVDINPLKTAEQRILWYELNDDVFNCSTGWDDDGNRYTHLTVINTGTAKLYAQDWHENGKRDECTIYVPNKVMVISCSPSDWVVSSETMGQDMARAFNCEGCYTVETPTNVSNFENCWNTADECVVIHTHGSPTGLFDHGENSTPQIISKDEISNLPINNNIHFIMMTACETAGGIESDNVAYWLSKKINPNGIVIANTDIVLGGSTSFKGINDNPTWKVYKNGIIQASIDDVTLTMQSAYSIYELYK